MVKIIKKHTCDNRLDIFFRHDNIFNEHFSILIRAEFLLGNFATVFIALLSCMRMHWTKGQKISMASWILTVLLVSRTTVCWVILVYGNSNAIIAATITIWSAISHLNIWLAESLSLVHFAQNCQFLQPDAFSFS